MSTAIRVQKDVREQASIVADGMGVSLSELVTDFLIDLGEKQKVSEEEWEKNLPVIVLSEKARKRLRKSVEEAERGIGLSPGFTCMEEAKAWLRRDDDDDDEDEDEKE